MLLTHRCAAKRVEGCSAYACATGASQITYCARLLFKSHENLFKPYSDAEYVNFSFFRLTLVVMISLLNFKVV